MIAFFIFAAAYLIWAAPTKRSHAVARVSFSQSTRDGLIAAAQYERV